MFGANTTVGLPESIFFDFKTRRWVNRKFCNFSPQLRLFVWCLAQVFIFRGLDHSGAETAGMLNSAKARR